jgi:peptidyl-tRNA hydrolase
MTPDSKLYIITRADLIPGARAAQSCHAMRAFIEEHPGIDKEWYAQSNNIVLLEVADEHELYKLALRARSEGIPYAVFREPDFDNTITGIALAPEGSRLVSNKRLALRDVA